MRMHHLAAAVVVLVSSPALARAQDDVPSEVSFTLKQSFFESLFDRGDGHSVGGRLSIPLKMGGHSKVHALGDDCEIHAAGKPTASIGTPSGVVVEPPNVCKRRIPAIGNGAITTAWQSYFETRVKNKTCTVVGFPRIFSEHATGGTSSSDGSNPDHVFEIHPALSMDCAGSNVDFEPFLRYYAGMRAISEGSAAACLGDRKLYVRLRQISGTPRYQFAEEGAKGGQGRCGNFVIVEATVGKDYIRALSNGKGTGASADSDHVALARVWVGENGPYPLKIYTYGGTPSNARIAQLDNSADESDEVSFTLHGLLTYDYYTIGQVIRERNGSGQMVFKPTIADWTEVSHPLALVVFGIVP